MHVARYDCDISLRVVRIRGADHFGRVNKRICNCGSECVQNAKWLEEKLTVATFEDQIFAVLIEGKGDAVVEVKSSKNGLGRTLLAKLCIGRDVLFEDKARFISILCVDQN